MPSEDYYDILQFYEDYTGYDGRAVWDFIHSKIALNASDATNLTLLQYSFLRATNSSMRPVEAAAAGRPSAATADSSPRPPSPRRR